MSFVSWRTALLSPTKQIPKKIQSTHELQWVPKCLRSLVLAWEWRSIFEVTCGQREALTVHIENKVPSLLLASFFFRFVRPAQFSSGVVVVDSVTARLATDLVQFEKLGTIALKGKAVQVEVYTPLGPAAASVRVVGLRDFEHTDDTHQTKVPSAATTVYLSTLPPNMQRYTQESDKRVVLIESSVRFDANVFSPPVFPFLSTMVGMSKRWAKMRPHGCAGRKTALRKRGVRHDRPDGAQSHALREGVFSHAGVRGWPFGPTGVYLESVADVPYCSGASLGHFSSI